MTPLTCRLLPHSNADGPVNMARDEAMLDHVSRHPEAAAFRTYGWTEPTLSLGYFQSVADLDSDPRWRTVPVVRRPTGGGAIWHDHEITYALAVPRTHPLSHRSRELYCAVHAAIAGLLSGFGVDARRRGKVAAEGANSRPWLCFTDRDPEDLVVGVVKIVGSAQRRRAGAVLQHGSLLLARSAQTPELPGAAEVAAVAVDVARWSDALRRGVPEALGLVPDLDEWPEGVLEHARQIENAVYRDPGWMRRR